MKISELIERLEIEKEINGDLGVYLGSFNADIMTDNEVIGLYVGKTCFEKRGPVLLINVRDY